jgi:hypothetical protein
VGRKGFLFVIAAATAWLTFAPSALAFGAFGSYEPYPTGGAVYGADVGDFSGDHIPDMIVANDNPSHISYLHGRKNGIFNVAHTQNIADDRQPEGIVVGKFNSDSISDFAAADYNGGSSSTVSIFLGRSSGKPKLFKSPLPTGDGAWEIATADLNGDHKKDLVTGNYDDGSVSVLLGKGKAKFEDHVEYPVTANNLIGLAIGDMDGDGVPDIVTLDDGGVVGVLLGVGDGTFGTVISTPAMGSDTPGYQIVIGNFNAGTDMDAVVTDYTTGKIVFLPGSGDGHFGTPDASTSVSSPNGIAAADMTAPTASPGDPNPTVSLDGKLDLAIGTYTGLYGVQIFAGNGDGTFTHIESLQGDIGNVGAAEFALAKKMSKDAAPDVLVGGDGGVDVYINCKNNLDC